MYIMNNDEFILFSKEEYNFIMEKYCVDLENNGQEITEEGIITFIRYMEKAKVDSIIMELFMKNQIQVAGMEDEPLFQSSNGKLVNELEQLFKESK